MYMTQYYNIMSVIRKFLEQVLLILFKIVINEEIRILNIFKNVLKKFFLTIMKWSNISDKIIKIKIYEMRKYNFISFVFKTNL